MSDDSGLLLLLAGPVGATALYWALYRHYRNTDKSHAFEHETHVQAKVHDANDIKVGSIKGTQDERIDGENTGDYRRRLPRDGG